MRYSHYSRSYKSITLFLLLFLVTVSMVSADEPILTLDTGGHMAAIHKIIPMKDGTHIISASDDMTIRIWDIKTGKETQKILGQSGGNGEGKIYAIALTPDEKWLAVGGFLNYRGNSEWGNIRIYDLKTGTLSIILKSHKDVVHDLSISSDGHYLVSGSADKTLKVWDINNGFSLVNTFTGHTAQIYAVGIFKDGIDYCIVSAGVDNKAILWSLNNKLKAKEYIHSDKLQYLAINERYIAASGFDNKIIIFDHNLTKIMEIVSETKPAGLSFSPDGKLLLAGSISKNTNEICNIYDSRDKFKNITSFKKFYNTAAAVAFLDNSNALTGGGDNNDIYIWDAYTGQVKMQISGYGRRIWSVGINGSDIAFGNITSSKDGILEKTINLNTYFINNLRRRAKINYTVDQSTISLDTYSIDNSSKSKGFKRIDTEHEGYSLTETAGGVYGLEGAVIVINKNGSETGRITKSNIDGYRHNVYGFTKNGTIISGASNGFLTSYNTKGQEIAQFIGHSGEVLDIAIDGDTLISGSSDQTIKLWNLKELKNASSPSIDNEKMSQLIKEAETATGKKWTVEDVKGYLDKVNESYRYTKIPEIKPILSIFISDDNEWVVWTEDGFFNASPKGDQYVGWHVNKGAENAAEFYSARQFRRFLYRPDIIQKTIELGGSKEALDEIVKTEPSIRDITVENLIKRAPVDVRIVGVDVLKDSMADVTLRLGKNNTTTPERITLYVNGAQQLPETKRSLKGAKPGDILKYTVKLPDNKNTVKVTVENEWAENSNEMSVYNPSGNDIKITKESTLYVIAAGISHYPNLPPHNQLKSPPIDAKSIAEHFKRLEGILYKKVDVKVLSDDRNSTITSNMVEQALKEQTQKAGPLDTTIIFLAGHGVTDSLGSYHFITGDTVISGGLKQGTTLDWKRLHSIIDKTMGRRVVIVDTCQAGEVFSENKTDIRKLVKDVHDVNAIIYSGTSRQDSGTETSKGGVFTLSMVSGFEGKAAYEENFLPFLRLKDYVNQEVPRLNRDIMLGLYRAISVKGSETLPKKSEDEVIESVQRPVAVVPDGMERFIIYAK